MSVRQGVNTIAGAVGKYPLNERNVTNCITEIPQDIKLELSSGTLTLKAGSKVYVPNGAGVFDVINITTDIGRTGFGSSTGKVMIFVNNITTLQQAAVSNCSSGSATAPASGIYYKTDTNTFYVNGTQTPLSMPVCIINVVSGTATSIEQVFNGFGYIGSTVFALPGVKGLIPNGRNTDGSLKNIETEITNVQTYTYTSSNTTGIYAGITSSGTITLNGQRIYNETENFIYNNVNLELVCEFAYYINPSGQIANFTPRTVFHAVDYSDYMTQSGTIVAEQLPTSGNNYTWFRKYANGWVEQGGRQTGSKTIAQGSEGNLGAITLPIAMQNTRYTALASGNGYTTLMNFNSTTTSCVFIFGAYSSSSRTLTDVRWYICGMAAS